MYKLLKRNSGAIILMAMAIAFECNAAEYVKGAEHFAAVMQSGDHLNTGCAATDAAELMIGQPVAIVVLSKPQRLVNGFITSKSASPCAAFANADLAGPFYKLDFQDARFEPGELGIFIGKAVSSLHINEGKVMVEMNGMGYKFDACTSHEGVHLTVRSFAGARSKLVWHDYVYLGYDVEPTCAGKQLAAMDVLAESFNRSAPAPAR